MREIGFRDDYYNDKAMVYNKKFIVKLYYVFVFGVVRVVVR